jgi:hypothetical protein
MAGFQEADVFQRDDPRTPAARLMGRRWYPKRMIRVTGSVAAADAAMTGVCVKSVVTSADAGPF